MITPTKKQAQMLMRLYEGERKPFCPLIFILQERQPPRAYVYIQISAWGKDSTWGLYRCPELTAKMLNTLKKKGYILKANLRHPLVKQVRKEGNLIKGVYKLSHAGKHIGRESYLQWELVTCIRHKQEEHQRHEQELKRLKNRQQYLIRTLKADEAVRGIWEIKKRHYLFYKKNAPR